MFFLSPPLKLFVPPLKPSSSCGTACSSAKFPFQNKLFKYIKPFWKIKPFYGVALLGRLQSLEREHAVVCCLVRPDTNSYKLDHIYTDIFKIALVDYAITMTTAEKMRWSESFLNIPLNVSYLFTCTWWNAFVFHVFTSLLTCYSDWRFRLQLERLRMQVT